MGAAVSKILRGTQGSGVPLSGTFWKIRFCCTVRTSVPSWRTLTSMLIRVGSSPLGPTMSTRYMKPAVVPT